MLPWEFLYDAQRDRYPSLSSNTPLVRYLDLSQPVEPLAVSPPLKVLGMVTNPSGLETLDVEHEKRLVEEAIKGLREAGLLELTWLEGQTWRHLQRAMRLGPWHIFHFVGHGGFDPATEEGALALSDDVGRMRLLRARGLTESLDDHYPLRMVFLNSCEGARGSESDAFSSTAATLVRRGVPAVVAMQYEITDKAAIEFSRDFYDALADGLPVDAAVTEARAAVSMDSALEWGTPVLYMHSPDGRVFDVATPRVQPPADNRQDDTPDRMHTEQPEHPEGLAASSMEAPMLEQRTAALYEQGLRHAEAEEWRQALECFEEVRQVRPDYRDTEEFLFRGERALARLPTMQTPDLTDQSASEARHVLEGSGLTLGFQEHAPGDDTAEGCVIRQSPEPGTEVVLGSQVSITVSSGPDLIRGTAPASDRAGERDFPLIRAHASLPEGVGSWWTLVLSGLLLAVVGLIVLVASHPERGTFRLCGIVLLFAEWAFYTIDARTAGGRRGLLLIQGRTSGLVGLLVLLVWLLWDKGFAVTVVHAFASKVGESDVTSTVETIVHNWSPAQRLIGAWAILIGPIRGFAAIRLRQEAIGLLLMGTSGALLVLAGILLLPQHVWSWDLLGFVLLSSGISLVAVALLERRGPP